MQASNPDPSSPLLLGGWRRVAVLAGLFLMGGAAGWVFERLGAPLPWMIGPLLATAAVFMTVSPQVAMPVRLRPVGQIVVATQVGLAFSPEALDLLIRFAPVIFGAAIVTALSVLVTALAVARVTRQSRAEAFLSLVPTSPVEAAAMAVKLGFAPSPIIFSQTLRMAAVVLILPFGLYALDGWPEVSRTVVGFGVPDPLHILTLVAMGVVGALVFRVLRVPNPDFLGPMAMAALFAVSGNGPMIYPPDIFAMAQVLLGTWLGAAFRRDFIASAWRLTLISLASSGVLLLLCALSGVAIAVIAGVDWQTMVLGTAPGGVVQMALAAKFLGQSAVLISTFHLVRIFIIMPSIPLIVRLLAQGDQRRAPKRTGP
jgi:membrane AbrB-like protein